MAIARLIAFFVRFRTLPLAELAFRFSRNLEPADYLAVPYLGYRLPLELSRSVTHRLLYLEGERFVAENQLLKKLVSKNDVVIDVGANIGYLTLLFRKCVGEHGKIVCIEPDADNLRELRRCIELNDIRNVDIEHAAVGAMSGTFRLSPGLNGHIGEQGIIEVPQITLDSLIEKSPSFVKVDVEGYESQVLEGAMQLISKLKPKLFVELHPALVPHRGEIRAILNRLSEIYPVVKLHEYRTGTRAMERVLIRYGMEASTARIEDVASLLAAVEDGSREQPFWVVAQQ